MCLVEIRPPTVDEWEKYKYHYRARFAMKLGIIVLWQVSGRSNIADFEEVVRLDTEYIQHWSLGLDIKILFKTVKEFFPKMGRSSSKKLMCYKKSLCKSLLGFDYIYL